MDFEDSQAYFGRDPQAWRAASPAEQLSRAGAPILAVCSSRRADACPQAQRFVARATALGTRAQVLEQPLSHGDINATLGQDEAYTRAVEAVLGSFDPGVAALLGTAAR